MLGCWCLPCARTTLSAGIFKYYFTFNDKKFAQILGSVPASNAGKAAALNRIAQISATAIAPLITGAYTDHDEARLLCYINIGICLFTLILIELYGNFMGKYMTNLPWCMSQVSMERIE